MKKILLSILLLIAISVRSQVITGIVTVTNTAGTTTGQSITVNGSQRNYTNFIQSYQNNILATNNIFGATSNLWISYLSFVVNGVNITQPATNQVQFQAINNPLTMSISSGWGTLSFFTNPSPGTITNFAFVTAPAPSAGSVQVTNMANSIEQLLNSPAVTNALSATAPAFANFATLPTIVAYSLANTNFTLVTSNSLKTFSLSIGSHATNNDTIVSNGIISIMNGLNLGSITPSPNGPAFQGPAFFMPSNNILTQIEGIFSGGVPPTLSYIEPGTLADIMLFQTNVSGVGGIVIGGLGGSWIPRYYAPSAGPLQEYFEDGIQFLRVETSHNVEVTDHAGTIRWQMNDPAAGTLLGGNYWTGAGGQVGLSETYNGYISTLQPVSANTATWTTELDGTVTNFITYTNSLSNSSIAVDYVQWPAYGMITNGDSLTRDIGIEFASSSATKQLQVNFNGSTILDTGSIANSGGSAGGISAKCVLTVNDASTPSSAIVTYAVTANWTGTTSGTFTHTAHTTVDLTSSSIDYHISLITGAGGANGDERVAVDHVMFHPDSTRAVAK